MLVVIWRYTIGILPCFYLAYNSQVNIVMSFSMHGSADDKVLLAFVLSHNLLS